MSWEHVKIGDFLRRSKIPVDIEDDKAYKRVTIRTKHQGVSVRDDEIGKKIGTKKQFVLKKGQFVLSKIDARYGAFGIAPNETDGAIITGNFWAYDVDESIMNINWFNQYTNSSIFYDLCERASSGITHRKYLNEDFFLNHDLLIPDVREQDAHVLFVEDRKSRIGILENEHFHQLDLLKKLRQQILQDAVQGKLVPQDLDDEPATKLLERIKAEKEKLVLEKKIKKEKPLPLIKFEKTPFEIPENWVWCRLSDIGIITGGGTPSMSNPEFWNGDIPWISPKDMIGDYVQDTEMKVTQKGIENSTTKLIPKGSLIIVGRSGILKRKLPVAINEITCTVNQDMKVIIPHLTRMNRYLQLMLFGLEKIVLKDFVKFGMTVHSLKYDEFADMPIPLPPITEQHRIVAKIEQLMTFCNELEQSLLQNQKFTHELLQVALKEALEPKIN